MEEAQLEEPLLDPEAVKVRGWRHSIQKAFLSKKGPPEPEVSRIIFFSSKSSSAN